MADTADISASRAALLATRQPKAEMLFLGSVLGAIGLWLALSMGFASVVDGFAGEDPALAPSDWLLWVPLVTAAFALWRVVSVLPDGFSLTGNRLSSHVIAWLITAGILVFINLAGDAIEPVMDLLGKSGAIIVRFCEDNGFFWAAVCVLIAGGLAAVGSVAKVTVAPGRVERTFVQNLTAKLAAVPMFLVAIGVFTGGTIWTMVYSFTDSKLLPRTRWIGLDQYERLWGEPRWIQSLENLLVYGVCSLVLSLLIGFILAALLDQKIRFENTFRTILLYPFALSFIVTGLVWQWVLNPDFGIQSVIRGLGWTGFNFDPLYNQDIVIFGILIAGLWQGTGLIMCLMLAGLRGIDEEIWKASRIDGIPMWKTYLFIIIPMMRPVFITTLVLISSGIVRLYDLVVAQTSGGPGIASEVPAKYVYDKMFLGQNLGQGFAASTMMLLSVLIVLIPWAYLEFGGRREQNS